MEQLLLMILRTRKLQVLGKSMTALYLPDGLMISIKTKAPSSHWRTSIMKHALFDNILSRG